jgi:hypothetical protein
MFFSSSLSGVYSHLVRISTSEPRRLWDRQQHLHKNLNQIKNFSTRRKSRDGAFDLFQESLTSWLVAKVGKWQATTSNHTDLDCKTMPNKRTDQMALFGYGLFVQVIDKMDILPTYLIVIVIDFVASPTGMHARWKVLRACTVVVSEASRLRLCIA